MRTLARLAGATYLAIFVTGLIFRNFIPDSGSLTAHWGAGRRQWRPADLTANAHEPSIVKTGEPGRRFAQRRELRGATQR